MISILAAALGWIALPVSMLRYQACTPTGVLLMSTLASFLFAGHYALIGAYSGAFLTLAGAITSLLQVFAHGSLSTFVRVAIATPSILLALYFSTINPLGILAILAFAASRIAETWAREDHMRLSMVGAALLWATYAASVGTIPVFLAEAIGLASAGFAYWRFSYAGKKSAGPAGSI